jgi:hypothetical protein
MMERLFGNQYVPLTFSTAFLEADLVAAAQALCRFPTNNPMRKMSQVSGYIGDLLLQMQPVTEPATKQLVIETKSSWSAVFENGIRGADVGSAVYCITKEIGCRGLMITSIPDRPFQGGRGVYGAIKFTAFDQNGNEIRHIHVLNDGPWKFFMEGGPLPFERVDRYAMKRIRDRLTPDMLDEYCRAIGVRPFDPDFYGDTAYLIEQRPRVSKSLSLWEAQSKMGLV